MYIKLYLYINFVIYKYVIKAAIGLNSSSAENDEKEAKAKIDIRKLCPILNFQTLLNWDNAYIC